MIKKGVRENAFLIYCGYKEQRVFPCLKTVQAGTWLLPVAVAYPGFISDSLLQYVNPLAFLSCNIPPM